MQDKPHSYEARAYFWFSGALLLILIATRLPLH
jgi:hypothetical protein